MKLLSQDRSKNNHQEEGLDPLFEFAAFLAAAARGSIDEGGMGASLRFLDALGRLPSIFTADTIRDDFLSQISEFVKENMDQDFLESREKYINLLDQLQVRFAKEIRKRSGLSE